jgi:hypothetical protein
MRKISKSTVIYIGLVVILAASNAITVFLQYTDLSLTGMGITVPVWAIALVNALAALILYGGLGYLGLALARRMGFADLWDDKVNNRQRFLVPGLIGAALGIFLIMGDQAFAPFNGIGNLAHPAFPASIFASLSAGIGEEIIFRLFLICFWVWIISSLMLKGRRQNTIFWILAVISALAFGASHLPSITALYNMQYSALSPVLYAEILLLNGAVAMFAAYYMRKYGFLAAVGIHFWADIVWHVIWGLFSLAV